jgi:hypothetical protein
MSDQVAEFWGIIWAVIASLLAGVLTMLARRVIAIAENYVEQRLHIEISAADRLVIDGAVTRAAGLLQVKLAAGVLTPAEALIENNTHVQTATAYVLAAAPDALGRMKRSEPQVAGYVVGKLGNLLGQDPTVPTVPGVLAAVVGAAKAA